MPTQEEINKLDRIGGIWGSLENSYQRMKKEGETRSEFLQRISGKTPSGSHSLDALKSTVLSLHDVDPVFVSYLSEVFDVVDLNWDRIKETDIRDLDKFILDAKSVGATLSLEVDVSVALLGLNPYLKPPEVRTNPIQLHNDLGFITDTFFLRNGKGAKSMVESYVRGAYLLLKGEKSLSQFKDKVNVADPFSLKCYEIIEALDRKKTHGSESKLPLYCLFLSSDLFTFYQGNVNIKDGNKRIPLEYISKKKVGDTEYLVCNHSNKYLDTPVYCVL